MTHVDVLRGHTSPRRRRSGIRRPLTTGRLLGLALSVAVNGAMLALGSRQTPVALANGIAAPTVFTCEGGAWEPYVVPSGFPQMFVVAGRARGRPGRQLRRPRPRRQGWQRAGDRARHRGPDRGGAGRLPRDRLERALRWW